MAPGVRVAHNWGMNATTKMGRPPNRGKWTRCHLYLSQAMANRLKRVGYGSQSLGLRLLLARYDKLRNEKKNANAPLKRNSHPPPPTEDQPRTG